MSITIVLGQKLYINKALNIGFIGAGNIAKSHAFALAALPFYYSKPLLNLVAVTSATESSRTNFAKQFGFTHALDKHNFWKMTQIDTLFISSPNMYHYDDLTQAIQMPNIERIYIEKPLCINQEKIEQLQALLSKYPNKKIQLGFQYLQMASVRQALSLWKDHKFGNPLHFRAKYLRSGYLSSKYRANKLNRLSPAPIGGAMVDLGSHAFSLLSAFLGKNISIIAAAKSGKFVGVPHNSDLHAEVLLIDNKSKAIGSLVASRISKGASDHLELEVICENGAFIVSTMHPDTLKICLGDTNSYNWTEIFCGNDYQAISSFPDKTVSAGWLRSLIHAVYLFLGGTDSGTFMPNLEHGINVQHLLNDTIRKLHLK